MKSITVERSMHIEAPDVHQPASVIGISYCSNDTPSFIESYRCGTEHAIRRSEDNGRTWTICESWESRRELGAGRYLSISLPEFFLDPDNGRMFRIYRTSEAIEGVKPWDVGAPVGTTLHYIQVSNDEGITWSEPEQLIQKGDEFDEVHWAKDIWYGRNYGVIEALRAMKLSDGTILVPFWMAHLFENGSIRSPEDNGVLLQNVCLFGAWRPDGGGLDWEAGDYVTLPRTHSADGGDEISVDFLPDGRLFQIIRARFLNQPEAEWPSCKFFALSSDRGRTWSEPEPLRYTDGELAYSPACMGRVFRSKKNGRFYLITNLNDWPSHNCDPRSTLQIAEIDPETLGIIRETVTPIETRQPGQPINIRFSNWRSYEDRETGEFVLFMTACPGDVGRKFDCGCPPHCYRYDICLPGK
ncbi:MAG: exo-alpha-sialidase [Candidatus Latescibacteria bacterium]|nr:exo-alpha-sialidase [Candidatus Latescibacterota bacterium]